MVQEIKKVFIWNSKSQSPKRICFMVNRINAMTLAHYWKELRQNGWWDEGWSLEAFSVFFCSVCVKFAALMPLIHKKLDKSNDLHFNYFSSTVCAEFSDNRSHCGEKIIYLRQILALIYGTSELKIIREIAL